jgi:hypothetical protein
MTGTGPGREGPATHAAPARAHNAVVYGVAVGLLVVLAVIALAAYRGARADAVALSKADELITVLSDAGVERLPSQDQVARVLGDDGGSVCQDPGHALRRATLFSMLTNGAAGPGVRPVVTDSALLRGQLAVVSVYCPEHLEEVTTFLDGLETDDVAG